jgi:hypothetical protein
MDKIKIDKKKSGYDYVQPEINMILLDNEISLQLQSDPPGGPGEDLGLIFLNDNNSKIII